MATPRSINVTANVIANVTAAITLFVGAECVNVTA